MVRGTWLLGFLCLLPAYSQGPAPKLHLPDSVQPIQYFVELRLVPGEDSFEGTIDIDVAVRRPSAAIWIHGNSLEFRSAGIRLASKSRPLNPVLHENDLVELRAENPVPAGRASIHIAYSGKASRTLTDGLFQQRYNGEWYLFTKFEPVTARRAFPCFDEPSFKTPWTVTLHVPAKLRAFANAPMVSEAPEPGGFKVVRFAESKPIQSYLLALAVGPFDVVEAGRAGQNNVPLRVIAPRGRAGEAAYAATVTPKILALLEHYFGVPFPYEKLDQIAVPLTSSWGAMENAGLIAYGSDRLLAPSREDSDARQRSRTGTMAHEMAHQWFGDLVTTAWWDDVWLNEAFASWLSVKMLMELRPDWKADLDGVAGRNVAMNTDRLVAARKVRQPIEAPGDIANAFDGITYAKGSAVIGMFENYLSAGVFQQGVRLYLERHAWKSATTSDFLSALNSASGTDIGSAFSSFLDKGGAPLLRLDVTCRPKSAPVMHVRQERYLPLGSGGETAAVWKVPVCVTRNGGNTAERQCVLLTKPSEDFELEGGLGCPGWVMANQNGAGYYRTAYEGAWLDKLMSEGMPRLNTQERMAALNDVAALFSGGMINAADGLGTAVRFAGDADRHVVQATIALVGVAAELTPPKLQPNLARLIQSVYGPRARALGWIPQAGESSDDRLLRAALLPLLAIPGRDEAIGAEGSRLAKAWLENRGAVDPDLAGAALAVAAATTGDRPLFDRLVSELRRTQKQRDRINIVGALRMFGDPAIAGSAVDLLFAKDLEPRELTQLLTPARQETRPIVWDFVKTHFDELNARLPGARGIPFSAVLPLTASGFCSETEKIDVQSFFNGRLAKLKGGARNLASALESIRLCVARTAALQPGIVSFMKSY